MSPEGGIGHWISCFQFNEVLDKCKFLGVQVLYGGTADWEKSKSVYIKDLSGYELELSKISGGSL